MERNFWIKYIRRIGLPFLLTVVFVFGACKPTGNVKPSKKILLVRKSYKNFEKANYTSEFILPDTYEDSISLDSLSIKERKKEFLNMMLPAVLAVKAKLDYERQQVEFLETKKKRSPMDKQFLDKLEKEYKTKNLKVLAKRLQTFPVSIVLAQAALESGWGTSRFFQEANNPFGMWSFSDSHARVEALATRSDGKKVYLRKFKNLQAAVEAYYAMLATGRTFQKFRNMKMKTDNPLKLIQALNTYSERGSAYVNDLASVITFNNLDKYDDFEIGPQYLADNIQ
jgi:Bax protein